MRHLTISILMVLASAFATVDIAAQCGTPGTLGIPQIAVSNDVLGNVATFSLDQARPFAPWLWLVDTSSGPLVLPFGTFCIGSTMPLVLFDAVTGSAPPIGPSGSVSVPITLPLAASFLSGVPFAMQAVVVDPLGASNIAISNDLTFTPRVPELYILAPGTASPFGSTPGTLMALDLVFDQTAWSVGLGQPAIDMVRVPSKRWIVVLRVDGSLVGFDEETGTGVYSAPAIVGPQNPIKLGVSPDGSTAMVLFSGTPATPFGGGTLGALVMRALDGAGSGGMVTLPSSGASDLFVSPFGSTAYVRIAANVTPVDYLLPAVQSPPPLGAASNIVDWQEVFGTLYLLHGQSGSIQPAIQGIDLATGAAVLPVPASIPGAGNVARMRFGPGTNGPAFLLLAPSSSSLTEVAFSSLTLTGATAVPSGTTYLELSAGGNNWLLLKPGGATSPFTPALAGTLLTMPAGTLAVSTVATLPAELQQGIVVQDSDVVRRAFVPTGSSSLIPVPTDPVSTPLANITLPVSSSAFRFLQR